MRIFATEVSAKYLRCRAKPARLGLFPLVLVFVPVDAYANAAPSGLLHCLGQEDVGDYVDNLGGLSNLR
jgi:hypothetical protein